MAKVTFIICKKYIFFFWALNLETDVVARWSRCINIKVMVKKCLSFQQTPSWPPKYFDIDTWLNLGCDIRWPNFMSGQLSAKVSCRLLTTVVFCWFKVLLSCNQNPVSSKHRTSKSSWRSIPSFSHKIWRTKPNVCKTS